MTLLIAYSLGTVAVATWGCVTHSDFALKKKSNEDGIKGSEDSLLINGRVTAVYKSVDIDDTTQL